MEGGALGGLGGWEARSCWVWFFEGSVIRVKGKPKGKPKGKLAFSSGYLL